ncbi:MAG TPA: hypothetical protein VEZ71_29325 [Archangium sp.]|nr:hypothetical protein [Archangium sp.]
MSRSVGQAARLAMLIKGQDVIEDERKLRKIAAMELQITGAGFDSVKRTLQEADLLEEKTIATGKRVLFEKVQRLDFAKNYARLGEVWEANGERTEKEIALTQALDQVITRPMPLSKLDSITALGKSDRAAVIEVAANAAVLDAIQEQDPIYYSPLLWEVDPKRLAAFMKVCNQSTFATLIERVRAKPGTDFTKAIDPLVLQAVRGGILPSYRVTSTAGERVYAFVPYGGRLLTEEAQKTILDKARAIVACLRYGNEAATITRIFSPHAILRKLMDSGSNHQVGPHSELKGQYGMLVSKQIGKIIQVGSSDRFFFRLIDSPDNLLACRIAGELLLGGETLADKDPAAQSAVGLVTGTVGHPLTEVRIAKQKRAARADELSGLVEQLQAVR